MTACRPFPRSVASLLFGTVLAAMATVVATAAPLSAQQTSAEEERSAPEFRAGQWGAQFTATSGFAGAGVLRFRSPRTAWLLDATAAVSNTNSSAGSVASQVGDHSAASVATRLGLRRYGAPRGVIRSFYGGGVQASVTRTSSEVRQVIGLPSVKQTASSYKVGAFGELGASYFVTSQLALGARGVGTVGYDRTKLESQRSPTLETSSDGMFLQLGSVQLQVTLFF